MAPTMPPYSYGPWTIHHVWTPDPRRPDGAFDSFLMEAWCGSKCIRQTEDDSFYEFFGRLDREEPRPAMEWTQLPLFASSPDLRCS